ncbi:carbamoyltransferase HypF [Sulfurimonas sp.]|uniref:carbamoyltransferase HypF n=1 Tax=Sulfurimonas sp. TaxID=2022749 RepID=UPI003D114EDC
MQIRKALFVKGIVQGVGFRPFVYQIALENDLGGYVRNDADGVMIELQGSEENIELFLQQLHSKLPPLARIDSIESQEIELKNETAFTILQSDNSHAKTTLISPDIATCKECLNDLKTKQKYKNYFATNCTNCGPRYSILKTVPYDRINTSMSVFEMCESCQEEYNDPTSRRYHAQPISCNNCGPKLDGEIETFANYIQEGKIVAIKGMGGFHIVCDATNDAVVQKLRDYKNRPSKPFALMCKDIEQVKSIANVSIKEEELLSSKEAPIVILQKNSADLLSHLIAPNIDRIGCMLAYTPLHHLLFEHLQTPIVATSANLSEEPIITTKEQIQEKLPFVEHILDFDREIINAIDDSLVQIVDGKMQVLRLARGYAPKVIKLSKKSDKKILAVGANAKSTIAFVIEDNLILSPHIGDLDSLEAFSYFERTYESFKRFYDFEPDLIIHDKHPNYLSTKWAKLQNISLQTMQHHLAHIYATKAEFGLQGDYLGFSFDGTGFGDDATLWGGEIFVGDERKYHFKPLKLLGGVKAVKEPRRVALSLLFEKYSFDEVQTLEYECIQSFSNQELKMLHQSYEKNLNAPLSSSVGRLFDAVASCAELAQIISYEGESGLLCESVYDESVKEYLNFTIEDGVIEIDFLNTSYDKKTLPTLFINTLVEIIIQIAQKEQMEVILSGGVFQNKTLLELTIARLKKLDIKYFFQQASPINDGGIALGQTYYSLNDKK